MAAVTSQRMSRFSKSRFMFIRLNRVLDLASYRKSLSIMSEFWCPENPEEETPDEKTEFEDKEV